MSRKGRALESRPKPTIRTYAMNIRAAEAIVSTVPKPIKTLPISDVSFQIECSLLAAVAGAE